MQVRVYYNLHRKVWSVQHKIPGKGWRIFKHMPTILLDDVSWKVSAAGRARVLREKRKNVHAYAVGTLYMQSWRRIREDWKQVRYNPYEGDHFQADGKPITNSDQAFFQENREVWACLSR